MALLHQIKSISKNIHGLVVSHRRHLHANPELSFKEYHTAAFVKTQLEKLQIPFKEMGGTGIVATITGKKEGNGVIALRADMDALPITEANKTVYRSANDGVMHACGHDAHMASLLGTATILKQLQNDFGGVIKLIFQPGEEILPGGASILIHEGVLKNPVPDMILGQHVSPFLRAGTIGIKEGNFMASMDEIFMTVYGKGGHAAQPEHTIDPIIIAANILTQLQQVVSRKANPLTPTVLSFGKIEGNGAINIIPDKVILEGTLRTMNEDWREEAHELIKTIAKQSATSMGGSCTITINKGYPVLYNSPVVSKCISTLAREYLTGNHVLSLDAWMAAEDFAYYAQHLTSCFYILGVGNIDKNITASLHTPWFDIDEDALQISTGFMAYAALTMLNKKASSENCDP